MESGKPGRAHDDPKPVFAAVIRPHRSLGRNGFRVMMILCAGVAGATAIRFATLGFWPVGGFLMLDLVGLYLAFRISYRRGRAFEEVVLTPIELMFRRVTHRGDAREWRLNPLWTRLHRETDEDYGLQRLALVSRGERITIAGELSPPEREHFADEFGNALAQVKRGY
ncbi:DUF2244 domain-containing protein [Enterovirga aerilata]|uniref:DUF2244 domain-containing protein n=1 Tax=Enterovirga aerilata TaxID=2730920 RepID=A0A849I8H7_9HYPH|nr:DUF2244 domain-containing protein [Enterovirga sp. DB1703]NNM72370.1 DUF2244 domain-containing protein [Enterovirga sp. DB1703]